MYDTEPEYRLKKSAQSNTGTRIIFISTNLDNLHGFCLGLSLARYGIKPMTLLAENFILKIQLYKGKSRGRGATGYYFESNDEGRLEVDTRYLDSWLHFHLAILHDKETIPKNLHYHTDWEFSKHNDVKKSKSLYLTLDLDI